MANRRIKISELPKITYNPQAGPLDSTMSKNDFMAISVTDRNNVAVKTSMAVTTRELQRFILQQAKDLEDSSTELTIGRPDVTVKMTSLTSTNIDATTGNISHINSDTLSTTSFTVKGALTVGNSVYPSVVRNSANQVKENLLLVSSIGGQITKTGKSIQELLSESAVAGTSVGNPNRVVGLTETGKFNFNADIATALKSSGGFQSNPAANANEILAIQPNGGLAWASALQGSYSNVTVPNLNKAINASNKQFLPAVSTDQSILVTTSATPNLSDRSIEVASHDHMKLTTVYNADNDPVDQAEYEAGYTGEAKVIFNSPIVIGAKHEDNVDLTESVVSKDIPAQIGEIRWNIFNGIPTIYLAVQNDNVTTGAVEGSKIWYGVPLFGTITNTDNPSVTANIYSNDD